MTQGKLPGKIDQRETFSPGSLSSLRGFGVPGQQMTAVAYLFALGFPQGFKGDKSRISEDDVE